MKKRVSTVITGICIFAVTTLAGCFKDSVQRTYTYTYYKPVYKTTAEVRLNIKSNAPQPIERPGKIFLLGNYIFLNEDDSKSSRTQLLKYTTGLILILIVVLSALAL